jgi:hypothetical protein
MIAVIIYVVVSLLLIGILLALLLKCKNKDKFCISEGIAGQRCGDPQNFQIDYINGWTEYADLTKEAPIWKEEMPETRFQSYPDSPRRCSSQ